MTSPPLSLRPRHARVAGGIWLVAAAALLLAGLVVVVDQHRLGWELPLGIAAGGLGWWLWQRRLVVDAHGIEQQVGWRRTRLLWAVVESVEIASTGGVVAPLRVHLVGRESVVLAAAWGLSHAQRDALARSLDRSPATDGPVPV